MAGLFTACGPKGGMGGGGKGSDAETGWKTGAGKESNTNLNPNTGTPVGTLTPDGQRTSNTVNGAKP